MNRLIGTKVSQFILLITFTIACLLSLNNRWPKFHSSLCNTQIRNKWNYCLSHP